ncbi:MAG: NfeD family protein [Haloferacaceae archaeon]
MIVPGPIPLQGGLVSAQTLPLLLVIAGLVLSIAEAMAPGAHFIVVGIALLAAGLVGLVLGAAATPFVLGFLVLVFGGLALLAYRNLSPYRGTGQGRTSDVNSLRGRTGRVTERVTPTEGQVKLDDGGFSPYYAARAVDGAIPAGTEVMVVDPGGGNVLTVAAVDGREDAIDRELARGRERERTETEKERTGTGKEQSANE